MKFEIKTPADTLQINAYLLEIIEQLKDGKTFDCEIIPHRRKRTLTQNAYMWSLVNEIANVVRLSKDEVYLKMLQSYGQSQIISVLSKISIAGYFKYFEKIGKGEVNGQEFTHYKVYKGSSEMDTREMTILTDGVIEEAKQLGIQTLTPKQLADLRSLEQQRKCE